MNNHLCTHPRFYLNLRSLNSGCWLGLELYGEKVHNIISSRLERQPKCFSANILHHPDLWAINKWHTNVQFVRLCGKSTMHILFIFVKFSMSLINTTRKYLTKRITHSGFTVTYDVENILNCSWQCMCDMKLSDGI